MDLRCLSVCLVPSDSPANEEASWLWCSAAPSAERSTLPVSGNAQQTTCRTERSWRGCSTCCQMTYVVCAASGKMQDAFLHSPKSEQSSNSWKNSHICQGEGLSCEVGVWAQLERKRRNIVKIFTQKLEHIFLHIGSWWCHKSYSFWFGFQTLKTAMKQDNFPSQKQRGRAKG